MSALFTIGFTQKTASEFFSKLQEAQVKTVVDTRLNNTGQLAGFAKRDDLKYFLERLIGVGYVHWLESAPTDEILGAYRKKKLSWDQYETEYRRLLEGRNLKDSEMVRTLDSACLLCSEAKPHRCHRRLLAEYLDEAFPGKFQIRHLV
jgi:uncharacterized protein (DUF488 family)